MSQPGGLVAVAQIIGAFGVRGEVRVRSFTEAPEAAFSYGPLMDEAGQIVLTPKRWRRLNDGFAVTTAEQRQREDWERLRSIRLHARREALPEAAADDGEVYVADLIGARVEHADGRRLGVVRALHNFGAGELVEVQPETGQTYFLPFTEEVFTHLDIAGGVLTVAPDPALLPEGLSVRGRAG